MLKIIMRIRSHYARKKLFKAVRVLRNLEGMMKRAGVPRTQRRSVWRSMAGSDVDRERVISKIAELAEKTPI